MSIISVSNLTFCYDGSYDNVFEDVSFQLDTDWKLGFTGRNGRGKTTFLKLLLGDLPYQGKISASTDFSYFPFSVPDTSQLTQWILEEVAPDAESWKIQRECSLLELNADALYRPFNTLSNGEQTKALLAALFCRDNQFLLIDEPTNHLDEHARAVVSDYLKGKRGFILVSHDRAFLDNCIDHILSINRTHIEIQKGNFSSWYRNKELQDQFEFAENEKHQLEIARLSEAARRTSAWSNKLEKTKHGERNSGLRPDRGYIGRKSADMMRRAKSLEARQLSAIAEKSKLLKNIESAEALAIKPLTHHAKRLLELQDVYITYGEHPVCGPVSFSLLAGDRVVLRGRNGSGKSSLIKLILGQAIAHTGRVSLASNLTISYVSQDTAHLVGNLADYAAEQKIDESLFKAILRKLDFSRVQFEKDLRDFSQGQKKKVLLAGSLCQRAHLYIWDEPLNYIDILSRMQIEDLLKTYRPTLLFVEHDIAFSQAVATKTVEL